MPFGHDPSDLRFRDFGLTMQDSSNLRFHHRVCASCGYFLTRNLSGAGQTREKCFLENGRGPPHVEVESNR